MPKKDPKGLNVGLDEIDIQILDILSLDARVSIADIEKKVKLSRDAVKYRIDRLKKEGIISSFVPVINPRNINLNAIYTLFISLKDLDDEKLKSLSDYLMKNPFITNYAKTIGAYDIILTVVAKDEIHFNSILSNIRKQFSSIISQFTVSQVIDQPKNVNWSISKINSGNLNDVK